MYPYHPYGRISPSFLSKYLSYRTVADRTNSDNFPAVIHQLVEYLSTHEQTQAEGQTEDFKRALTRSLCEVAANDTQWRGWDSWKLIGFLRPNTNAEQARHPESLSRHKLAAAAYLGKKYLVQVLLEDGFEDMNGMTYIGTPLNCAAKGGNLEVVRLLLERLNAKCVVDLALGDPLSTAALAGHTDVVRVLLEPQYGYNQHKQFCESAILQATRGGHHHLVELIIRSSKYSPMPLMNNRILHDAALYGHADVVRMALDNGADVNLCDRTSRRATPISVAASQGHKHIVQLLLTRGANQHFRRPGTALYDAAAKGFQSVVQLLLDHGNYDFSDPDINRAASASPLKGAAEGGQAHMVRFILDRGMDLATHKEIGDMAIRCAASNGHDTVVRMLLDAGVDIDGQDETGSPMLAALCRGRHDIVRTLVKYGAKEIDPEKTIYADKFRNGTYSSRRKVTYKGIVLPDYGF